MEIEALVYLQELLGQQHEYGESVHGRLDMWISVSFAVIAITYIAPERLTPLIATLIVVLYSAFTVHTFTVVLADMNIAAATLETAKDFAALNGIENKSLEARVEAEKQSGMLISSVFMIGLLVGTIGYVLYIALQNYRGEST